MTTWTRFAMLTCVALPIGGASFATEVDLSYSELRPLPSYPRQAAIDCVEGEVLARFRVTEANGAESIEIVRSTPAGVFDQVVLDALERWTIHAEPGTELEWLFEFDLDLPQCKK